MNCPVCDAKLREVTKMGVQVDICPDCKGVWLDRGELDKIIDMAANETSSFEPKQERPAERQQYVQENREHYSQGHDDHEREHGHGDSDKRIDPRTGKPKRKESILTNIFDMFGEGGD